MPPIFPEPGQIETAWTSLMMLGTEFLFVVGFVSAIVWGAMEGDDR